MLKGNDFIILNLEETEKIYKAIAPIFNIKERVKKLQKLGILDIVSDMKEFLYKDEE